MAHPYGEHIHLAKLSNHLSNNNDKAKEFGSRYKYGILVVGQTGTGKSSLIRTMTGNNDIKVSGSSQSCTQKNGFYSNNDILYIDTKGTMDRNENTEITLKNIKKDCYKMGINKIKIIWCIDSTVRGTSDLDKQAQMIQSYENENNDDEKHYSNNSIWDSVLVIQKEGMPNVEFTKVLDSVKKCSNNNNQKINCIGYTCIDWWQTSLNNHKNNIEKLPNDEYARIEKNMLTYNACKNAFSIDDLQSKFGYFKESEIKKIILNKLNNELPNIKVNYNFQKCNDCGIIADFSMETQKCHMTKELYHACGNKERYHIGIYEAILVNNETIYGDLKRTGGIAHVFWIHPGVHIARAFQSNTKEIHRWSCCGQNNQNAGGCMERYTCGTDNGCEYRCSCCKIKWGQGPCC